MRKKNAFLAAAVIGALPLLMLLQQRLMPRNNPAAPPHLMLRQDQKLLWATEDGLIYNRFYARNVAYAAGFYAARGEHVKAQKWFQLGAAEFRYPSVMLLYGDYHLYSRKYRAARRWYELARSHALQDRQAQFLHVLTKRIDLLDSLEKKGAKK